ncbi:uncharacterized protein LOC108630443, partial [Ceratina calcarata]|uniref:Uncharacterized protein LOC108630443 n=1 Tax=Ceratina calcarata TaxID=156304 RepID=A0AAJ7ND15_9HYME
MEVKFINFKKEIVSLLGEKPRQSSNTRSNLPSPSIPSTTTNLSIPAHTPLVTVNSDKPLDQLPESWAEVTKSRGRRNLSPKLNTRRTTTTEAVTLPKTPQPSRLMKKPRNVEVIHISTNKNSSLSLCEILTKAKENINLQELGIDSIKPRSAMNGGLLLEIPKKGNGELGPTLMNKISSLFSSGDVNISCPKKYKELLITNLDLASSHQEINNTLRTICGDNESFILGPVRPNARGTATVWCKCNETAAFKLISKQSALIGWSTARFLPLENRPIQCFKCWDFGHVRNNCTSEIDMIDWCYKCGHQGHPSSTCSSSEAICKICERNKFKNDHKMGT